MKKKRLLIATGLSLVSLATIVGGLWHKYKDRVLFYDEPNIGLYTGLRISWPLVVDLEQPDIRWFGGISQKIENTEWEERALFGFGKYGSVFHLIEANDSEGKSFVIDFNPKKEIYLKVLSKNFPKIAKYLGKGGFSESDKRVHIIERSEKYEREGTEGVARWLEFEFPDGTKERYDPHSLMRGDKGGKETLMDKVTDKIMGPRSNLLPLIF